VQVLEEGVQKVHLDVTPGPGEEMQALGIEETSHRSGTDLAADARFLKGFAYRHLGVRYAGFGPAFAQS
jgi:hypothetical protein